MIIRRILTGILYLVQADLQRRHNFHSSRNHFDYPSLSCRARTRLWRYPAFFSRFLPELFYRAATKPFAALRKCGVFRIHYQRKLEGKNGGSEFLFAFNSNSSISPSMSRVDRKNFRACQKPSYTPPPLHHALCTRNLAISCEGVSQPTKLKRINSISASRLGFNRVNGITQ